VISFYLSSFFLSSPNLRGRTLDVYHTSTHGVASANLECRSEMCCTRLAASAGPKKVAMWAPLHNFVGLWEKLIFATKARIDNLEKNLLSSNISPTCPHNMVNFGPLAAEIVSLVWGTRANFNRFGGFTSWQRYCTAVIVSFRQTSRRWTEDATYVGIPHNTAWRPSRWTLAHISVLGLCTVRCQQPTSQQIGGRFLVHSVQARGMTLNWF